MSRCGNRGLRPYCATLAAAGVLAFGLWAPSGGIPAAGATPAAPNWSALAPPARPPALAYAAEAFDPANQTVVLFGGVDPAGGLSGATWVWNGTTWSEAPAQLSGPAPRELASLAYFPGAAGQTQGQLILFGGESAGGTPLGDTWAWNGQSWVAMAGAHTTGPAARFGASLAADATGNLVLFGGTGTRFTVQGSMNAPALSSTTSTTSPTASATGPSTARSGAEAQASPVSAATATATGAQVTGAARANAAISTLNDTWVWNGTGWSQPNLTASPPARTDAALVWDPAIGQTVLFGGSATPTTGGAVSPIGDTWVWSGSAWTSLRPAASPPPRYDAASGSAGALGGDVLVGGDSGSGQLGDAWTFTGATWTPLRTTGTLTARSAAASAGNPASSQLMVFGGRGPGGNLDDTDLLTPAPPVQVNPAPSGAPSQATNGPSTIHSSPPAPTPTSGTTSSPGASGQPGSPPGSTTRATGPVAGSSGSGTGQANTPTSSRAGATTTAPVSVGAGSGARITSGGAQPGSGTQPATSARPTSARPGSRAAPTLQTVHTGSLVTVLGSGFEPGATITITFHSRPYTVGRTVAGAQGTFSATVTVPANASPGHHHLEASGMGLHGRVTVLLTPLLVVGSLIHSSGGTPRRTTIIMVAVSVFLPIGTWACLGIWNKRRRRPVPNP